MHGVREKWKYTFWLKFLSHDSYIKIMNVGNINIGEYNHIFMRYILLSRLYKNVIDILFYTCLNNTAKTVGAASQWWLNGRMMVYFKLMMVKGWDVRNRLQTISWIMVGHEFFFSLSPLFLDPLHVDKT